MSHDDALRELPISRKGMTTGSPILFIMKISHLATTEPFHLLLPTACSAVQRCVRSRIAPTAHCGGGSAEGFCRGSPARQGRSDSCR